MELCDVLTELAWSGRLGPIFSGAAWETVVEAFGEPWDVGVSNRRSRLLAYGDLELSVCRCPRIMLICVQTWRDVVEFPVGLVGRQTFPGRPRYSEVIEALDRAGCAWQPYAPLTFDDQCAIQAAASGVVFVFEISEGEDPILNVVGPQPDEHDCGHQR